jgi:hypothetical protein
MLEENNAKKTKTTKRVWRKAIEAKMLESFIEEKRIGAMETTEKD